MEKLIYAFDFDGTIVTDNFPEIGMPILNTIELIEKVKNEGHYIILNTMRENEYLMKALMFCKGLGIEFDAVNDNLPHMKEFYQNNPRKIFANHYIDDHNSFLNGVNDISNDLKIEQDRHRYYKQKYCAECDRTEKMDKTLKMACNFIAYYQEANRFDGRIIDSHKAMTPNEWFYKLKEDDYK